MHQVWRVRIGIDLGGTKIEGIALADDRPAAGCPGIKA
jgi:hypothetical protein